MFPAWRPGPQTDYERTKIYRCAVFWEGVQPQEQGLRRVPGQFALPTENPGADPAARLCDRAQAASGVVPPPGGGVRRRAPEEIRLSRLSGGARHSVRAGVRPCLRRAEDCRPYPRFKEPPSEDPASGIWQPESVQSVLTSAATVHGFKARIRPGDSLPIPSLVVNNFSRLVNNFSSRARRRLAKSHLAIRESK
jgi:hypothetical protein